MNRLSLLFVIFFAMNITLLSTQTQEPLQAEPKTYTEMFDSVFSVISKSQATTGILYEMVVPFANLTNLTVDTSNRTHFIQAYSELYRAAFDTTKRLSWSVAEFEAHIEDNASQDVIDIGILHYNFNAIDSVVAMQKLIIVDSVLVGEDTTISASLYSAKTAFVVSPLASFSETNQVTFRFNNDFYFDNTGATLTSLMVDFDDGQGLRSVSMGSNVLVTYLDGGLKTLRFVAI